MKHFIIAAEIYLAGGCFWGTEHFLKQIRGVESSEVGYANSIINQPTYQQVCSGETNAAETVKVVYDPETVNLSLLLDLYFKTIDPTSLNRQGNDRGTQYRTGIYYTNKADIAVINQAVRALADQYKNPIAIEVKPLTNFYPAENYHQDYKKVKKWYDGYLLENYQVYNPRAVVSVILKGEFRSYWSQTGSYEAVVPLISMDFEGLKTAIIEMLSGTELKVNTASFKNDPANIKSCDEVLTYLIHLGYLGYNQKYQTAFVPNEEIRQELIHAVESVKWDEMLVFWRKSEELLNATLDMDGKAVAEQIEKIHSEYVSVIQYHNENSLSSVLSIAYLSSMQYYFKPVRELPTGRGFADFIFLPKPEYKNDYPALVVELKWNKNAKTALQQIKEKKYPDSIRDYAGDILLVGINYDKDRKKHECLIEMYEL